MQKLIIKNKYQSPNRMNILTAAGIAQINEPITPKNGERIWGGLGVVTFNQASQYNKEENPDAPITPPNCTNCGGGIPPEVPPEKIPTYMCTSDCGDNKPFTVEIQDAPGFILREGRGYEDRVYYIDGGYHTDGNLTKTFALYNDALEYLEQMGQDKLQGFLNYKEKLLNEYYANNDWQTIESLRFDDQASIKYRKVYVEVCREYTKFNDGSVSENIIKGYKGSSTSYSFGMLYSFSIQYGKKEGTGEMYYYLDDWVIGRIFFNAYYGRCQTCNDCKSV